jgi:hypothetical protein
MLGYDISWAGFNIIEVMSSSKFTYKRIGYLSSSQSFHADTEVSLLFISIQQYIYIIAWDNDYRIFYMAAWLIFMYAVYSILNICNQ